MNYCHIMDGVGIFIGTFAGAFIGISLAFCLVRLISGKWPLV